MQSHFYSGHIKNSSASGCWMLPSPTCEFCCKLTVVIVMKKGPTQFCQHKGQTQKNDKFGATYGFTERLWWATYTKQTTMPYKDDSKYQVWSVNLNACFKEKHFSALLAQFCKREGGGGVRCFTQGHPWGWWETWAKNQKYLISSQSPSSDQAAGLQPFTYTGRQWR